MVWSQSAYGWSTSLLFLTACASSRPAAQPSAPPVAPVATSQRTPVQAPGPAATEPKLATTAGPSELACTLDQYTVVVDPWVKTHNQTAFECQMGIADEAHPVASLVVDPPVRFWENVHPNFSDPLVTSQAVIDVRPHWDGDLTFIFDYD